jgi:DNA polymerase-3 subunit delta'
VIPRLADVLGQPDAIAFLRRVVHGGRFANAYLLHGPAGVGKGSAALAFARALLCEHAPGAPARAPGLFDEPAAAPAAPTDDACGSCPACTRSGALQHPDLQFLFPVSGEERTLDDTIAETLAAMRDDPLHVFTYEKAASIRLSITRELLRQLAYKPYEAARRVVVVRDADRMREDQYSAMLKAIEEPGASTVWVLTTSRLHRLPATIRSRCQLVRFRALPERLIATFLTERAEVAPREATLLAALASGSLGRALEMRELDPVETRDAALALLEPALRGDPAGLWKAVQGATKFGKAGRETLRRTLEVHQLWLRDILWAGAGAPAETFVHRDREKEIRAQAARIGGAEVRRRLMVIEETLRAIEGNVTADLALFSGMARVAGARLGESDWPRARTARTDY